MLLNFLIAAAAAWFVSWWIMMRRRGVAFGILAWLAGVVAGTTAAVLWGLLQHYGFGVLAGAALTPAINAFVAWAPLGGLFGILAARRSKSRAAP